MRAESSIADVVVRKGTTGAFVPAPFEPAEPSAIATCANPPEARGRRTTRRWSLSPRATRGEASFSHTGIFIFQLTRTRRRAPRSFDFPTGLLF